MNICNEFSFRQTAFLRGQKFVQPELRPSSDHLNPAERKHAIALTVNVTQIFRDGFVFPGDHFVQRPFQKMSIRIHQNRF